MPIHRNEVKIGETFCKLRVIGDAGRAIRGQLRVTVQCDCGTIEARLYSTLLVSRKEGRTQACKKCGYRGSSKNRPKRITNAEPLDALIGQQFDQLIVESLVRESFKEPVFICRCSDCAVLTNRNAHNFRAARRNGESAFCPACRRSIERHLTEYMIWCNMKVRCYDPSNNHYHRYGGRGIFVCDHWLQSFWNFLGDMGPRPKDHSLDRIDNDGNYSPDNCKWSTSEEQARNTSKNKYFTYQGEKLTLKDIAKRMGIAYTTLHYRLRNGWTESQILSPELVKPIKWRATNPNSQAIRKLRKTEPPKWAHMPDC